MDETEDEPLFSGSGRSERLLEGYQRRGNRERNRGASEPPLTACGVTTRRRSPPVRLRLCAGATGGGQPTVHPNGGGQAVPFEALHNPKQNEGICK